MVLFDSTYTGSSPFPPTLAFGLTGFLGQDGATPFSTAQEWFAAYEAAGEPVPAPTDETISLLGQELDGFRIDGAFANGNTTDLAFLSCATDSETLADLQLFTAPYADVFTAETNDGVLVAIAHAFTEEEQLVARELFDAMLPTIEADQSAASSDVETVQLDPFNLEERDAGINQVDVIDGLEFELPEATRVITSGNCLIVEYPGYTGSSPFPPNFGVSLAVSSGRPPGDVVPLSTIEEFLELYGDEPAPVATGETLNFLGEELQAYEVAGSFLTEPPPEQTVNCGSGPGIASDLSFIPGPFATEFIAETPDGLLSVGYGAFTEEESELAREFFEEVFPTIAAQ